MNDEAVKAMKVLNEDQIEAAVTRAVLDSRIITSFQRHVEDLLYELIDLDGAVCGHGEHLGKRAQKSLIALHQFMLDTDSQYLDSFSRMGGSLDENHDNPKGVNK